MIEPVNMELRDKIIKFLRKNPNPTRPLHGSIVSRAIKASVVDVVKELWNMKSEGIVLRNSDHNGWSLPNVPTVPTTTKPAQSDATDENITPSDANLTPPATA